MIYTEFSKAFDKINFLLLRHKLYLLGFRDPILSWIMSFITDRSLNVKFKSFLSQPYKAFSGIPQGSHLGPYLFLIYINDIGQHLDTNFLLFADDLKLYQIVKSECDCSALQNSLSLVHDWCLKNNMELNAKKCCILSFGKSKNVIDFVYSVGEEHLDRVRSVKDLGVIFDSHLRFDEHILHIKRRSLQKLGFIMRNTRSFSRPATLIKLFNAYVRPILEYLSTVWSPQYCNQCRAVEMVQNKFLRFLYYFDASPPAMPVHGVVSVSIMRDYYGISLLQSLGESSWIS